MNTTTENRATIGKVMVLNLLLAVLVAMVFSSVPAGAAVPSDRAFAWGLNFSGQLGNGNSPTDSNVPVAVKNLEGVKSVKAGCDHGLALKYNGTVWAWGLNQFGQLGNGTNDDSDVPVKVHIDNVRAISAGCEHNLALKEDGSVWAWGDNSDGQLGNGTSGAGTESNIPAKVGSLGTSAKRIAAGLDFSLTLTKNETVKSWGQNSDGRLGNGTKDPRDTPGPVSNLSGVKAIATDSYGEHVLALLNDGRVKAWGENNSGQVGNGTSGNDKTLPVAVSNLTNVTSIAVGGDHSLALLESGKVKSWGYNGNGQLGNDIHGPNSYRSTPGNVIMLTDVRSISGGGHHSLAVLESGRARSWGDNYDGQLGNGTSGAGTESDVPVGIKNLTNVTNIDGGTYFTLAAT